MISFEIISTNRKTDSKIKSLIICYGQSKFIQQFKKLFVWNRGKHENKS